jgi:hypothetical protein
MKNILYILGIFPFLLQAQSAQLEVKKKDQYVFGQIYTDFRYCFNKDYDPAAAFNFNQGIIGYFNQLSPKVSGTIMFDVTRTTNIEEIADSNGFAMFIRYFEGSKYTAYLKMAEIKWDFHPYFSLRVGQLLNTQYLTFQDPFWGFRYIDVTFQERFRLGMPADFGAQIDFRYADKIVNQISVVNGEGPFRYQDLNGQFVFSENIQYTPFKGLTFKFYADYGPGPDTSHSSADKSALSFFAGYRSEKFRAGAEYDYVFNYTWKEDNDHYGFSLFAAYTVHEKVDVLARYDHLNIRSPDETSRLDYIIAGVQYRPVDMFMTAVNFRYLSDGNLPFVYASFGLKF